MANQAQAGYADKPLATKLGFKPGMVIVAINDPCEYHEEMEQQGLEIRHELRPDSDAIHLFATNQRGLTRLVVQAKPYLKKNGMLWVSWLKQTHFAQSDLNENVVRAIGLAAGLVDVKVCAVDQNWSGLKFVYRTKDRS